MATQAILEAAQALRRKQKKTKHSKKKAAKKKAAKKR